MLVDSLCLIGDFGKWKRYVDEWLNAEIGSEDECDHLNMFLGMFGTGKYS